MNLEDIMLKRNKLVTNHMGKDSIPVKYEW
jgi:hypothetical protein